MKTSITNIDGTPYDDSENTLASLTDAVSFISAHKVEDLLGDSEKKEELKNSEKMIHEFLLRTRIQANLLAGNYQAGLKMVTPIFFDAEGRLSELPYLNILVALLARLKKQTKTKFPIQHPDELISQLDTIVDRFISKDGTSPNDATAILAQIWTPKNELKLFA